MNVSPAPMFQEREPAMFERTMAPSIPMNKGPLRFEEGIATDTDVPNDFSRGAYFDTSSAATRQLVVAVYTTLVLCVKHVGQSFTTHNITIRT